MLQLSSHLHSYIRDDLDLSALLKETDSRDNYSKEADCCLDLDSEVNSASAFP